MAIRILIALAVFGTAGVYARQMDAHRVTTSAYPDLARLPAALDGWESRDLTMSEQVAQVLDADVTLERIYSNVAGEEVHVFVAYFAEQAVNSQIHSPRHCVPGSGWSIASLEATSLPLPGKSSSQPARRMLIRHQEDSQEMLYWFQTRSGFVTGEYALKWDLVRNSLARRPTDAVFVRYTAPVEQPAATRRLIAALDAPLHEILQQVGLP